MTGAYDWVEALPAYCFTVVVGVDEDELVRRIGCADPTAARTFDECFWDVESTQFAQVGAFPGGAVLVAEHNGWRLDEDGMAARLSANARLVCFFRNVNAVMRLTWAVDGTVRAAFDPLLDPVPTVLAPYAEGLPFGLHAAEQSAMVLLERLSGVRVTPDWLARSQSALALPPLDEVT